MWNTVIIEISISQLAAVPFKWVWDFNRCVWLMFPCLMRLHKKNTHMYSLRLIKNLGLLNTSNTSANRFKTSWINPIPSTSNDMINIGRYICFGWVTKFGCIYRNKSFLEPIKSFNHSNMGLKPLPRLWETMLSSLVSPHSLACT